MTNYHHKAFKHSTAEVCTFQNFGSEDLALH